MGTERNEILNAIQNGFFNEGIYCINEESVKEAEVVINPEAEKSQIIELITPPEQIIAVINEPEIKLDIIKKPEEPKSQPEQEGLPEYFGGNQKGVAIIVNYPDERWIYFKDKIILERILASVKLTFEDVALINTHYYKPESINELSETLNITKLIGFGIKELFLMGMKREEPEKTNKVSVFLMNSNLAEIAMDNIKKRILWNHIKQMFNIG